MGPARLDGYRVLSLAVPIAVVWLGALLLRFAVVGQTSSAALETSAKVVTVSVVAILAALAGATAWSASNDAPRYLNYAISGTDRVLGAADSVREEHFDGVGLPLLANPDLGKVSFAKRAIVIDLGLLGDPLLTRVVNERNDLMPAFMGRVARPDVVEVHGGFSCAYGAWMATPEFRDAHRSPDEAWSGDLGDDGCFLGGRSAVWFRTDADEEYALTRSIGAAEDPVPVVAEALDQCTRETGDVFRCEGVRRAVQRATPSLRERGRLDAVVETFGVSPSADLAEPMLRRGPGWADEAFEAFVGLASGP